MADVKIMGWKQVNDLDTELDKYYDQRQYHWF